MRRLIALICALPLVLAASGGDDEKPASSSSSSSSSSSGGGSASALDIKAEEPGDEEFGFDPKSLDAKAGKVTLKLTLPKGLKAPHGIAVDGQGQPGPVVKAGETSEVTVDLKPGKYTYYCPVGDHREEGMEGTLTVE
jgi:plastocyanin